MEVITKTKGVVSVDDDKILTFSEGIMGFEEYKKYAFIPSEYEPFIWLQSLDDKNLAFLSVDPFLVCSDYAADIDDSALKALDIKRPEDIIIMTIVTVPNSGGPVTANFLGPIVINKENRKCMQYVLSDNRWSTKFDILESVKKKGRETC